MKALHALIARVGTACRRIYWQAIYSGYRSRYNVAPGFRFNGFNIQLYGDGAIELASDSYIGELSTIQAVVHQAVRVGRGCMISHNVRIYTETAEADCDFLAGSAVSKSGDVVIGEGSWVGANVFIGPGVSIGRDAVVGANSVVTRDVPAGEIWGGVPAQRIRSKRR